MIRGKYILFEGGEGAGKSTQISLLYDYLNRRNLNVIQTREPGGTDFANEIREIVKSSRNAFGALEEMFLFSAARANLFGQVIIPNLEAGKWVISDRGFVSTEIYQGYAGNTNLSRIKQLNEISMQGINPDLIFILDVPTEIGLSKEIEGGRMSDKGREYHKKVREGYLQFARENPKNCVLIPYQEGHIEEIHKRIIKEIEDKFKL